MQRFGLTAMADDDPIRIILNHLGEKLDRIEENQEKAATRQDEFSKHLLGNGRAGLLEQARRNREDIGRLNDNQRSLFERVGDLEVGDKVFWAKVAGMGAGAATAVEIGFRFLGG